MLLIEKALVIGGGIAGMCAAIELRKRGVAVDLVEIDPEWRVYGAGISINGAALRALNSVGVVKQILEQGYCSDGCTLYTPQGQVIGELPTPRIASPDIPGGGGILRAVLARILSKATLAAEVAVRLGVTFKSITERQNHVEVAFTDTSVCAYDLVIGADGLNSNVRHSLFPNAPRPKYTGQGCWRALVPRLPAVTRACMHLGRATKAGLNPVSQEEMYLFCLDEREEGARIPESQLPALLKDLLAEFGGNLGLVRDKLDAGSRILYRPLEALLLEAPWHIGRTVLIGDAVHATTPHLAAGAAMGMEDALVLSDELDRGETVEGALSAFVARRMERCRMVVQNSLRLGEIEMGAGTQKEHADLMRDSMISLLAPA
jgi:2-polyprenyl-6-methoxyphenol hydroxylase-like FAD-dependent oxidoreductase